MEKRNFRTIAEDVLKAVGGSDNIVSATHCMTRLRLNLVDEQKVKDEAVKAIKGVIGVNQQSGQYQVIIGQTVDKVYAEFAELIEDKSQFQPTTSDTPKEKLTIKEAFSRVLDYLSGSMTPLIPAMITAAMFKTIQVILGPDLFNIIGTKSDIYQLCGFLYSAFFYFLPIFLGFTAAKKLGASQVMGLYVGAMLLVPELVQLAEKSFKVYGFIPTTIHDYSQSVIPVVLSVWVMSYVEKYFKKIVPAVLSTIFVPFLTMIVMTPLILALLAPIGNIFGKWIGGALISFGNIGGFVAVAVVAALWELLVMTGMHMVLITFALTALMTNGVDNFVMVGAVLATWATFGLALGAALRIRDSEEKALTFGYVVSGIVGGVTEPTIYGVMLKYKRTMAALIVGGGFAGAYAGLTHVGMYVAGASNFLSVVGYFAGGRANIINGFIATAIAFLGTAALTYFFGFRDDECQLGNVESDFNTNNKIFSPLTGDVVALSDVEDEVFSSGAMGDGVAILPSEGRVVAPADAEVTLLFPTKHAIGLKTAGGAEILIHVGMDTVSLNGNCFDSHVSVGDKVKKGQLLLTFDIEEIKKAGLTTVTPIIITNTADYQSIDLCKNNKVIFEDFLLELVK
ncbi:glucose PTS transporter subunit IIA [Streptococcus gallolyticus]|uniref:PTS system sucrose-specific EIIBCA component n=1 Tax=Streptococcus gallolyticus TaxID=315405 RepID=A0A1H9LVX8_9STRE|nr:glucose PTS transporter subunit IIA [Streptococcus gallolyticus]SER15632.1 PTS system IIB component, Glc family (TC 4.A.1)/PTS system IIC component, Glc family (TC 4.A.1) [Streptococcus gallolyticus]